KGNCWLIGALSSLALHHKHLTKRLFITPEVCEEGAYQIRLFNDGKWVSVMVDDRIPCDKNGYPYYAKALENQMWVSLIEKAVAKLYGCYQALDAGPFIEGLSLLTGVPCIAIPVFLSDNNRSKYNLNTTWSKLLEYQSKKYPMLACCGSNYMNINHAEAEEKGLVTLHCESDWKDGWAQAYSLDLYMPSEIQLNGPSDLWINLEDFTKYFSAVGVCKLRNEWFEETVSGKYPTYEDQTPSFVSFIVEETTEIEIVLYQILGIICGCINDGNFKCIAQESCCNITSSRGNTLNTIDSIPPKHGQIVAIYTKLKYEKSYAYAHKLSYKIVRDPELQDLGDEENSLNVPKIKNRRRYFTSTVCVS
ncbi:hypothetical protein ILUMI_04795, partial [Ignelater luminosus]